MSTVTAFQLADILFTGAGALGKTPDLLKNAGLHKPLIVTDQGIVKAGLPKQLEAVLSTAGFSYAIYDKTVANPTDNNVEEAFALYSKESCDCLIGLGGGSSMDTAKGCGILATNGGSIDAYRGLGLLKAPLPYFIAVPTTAGTGSESTCAAVITNTRSDHPWKMAILDGRLLPKAAIIDPLLMTGLPPHITAATGMDAMTHAVEAYISLGAMEYTDSLALGAIRLVFTYLRRAVANGNDLVAREKMAYAQTMAGIAFSNAGLGLVHSMAHPLSAFYGISHGDANALVLPYVLDFNKISCREKMADIAVAAGIKDLGLYPEDTAVAAIKRLNADVRIPTTITEAGARIGVTIDRKDIAPMSRDALNEVTTPTNPRGATLKDIEALYNQCW
ncbi:iron-containing alcohol dehydrogenase [Desulfovibrio legallii]|uniref:Iron-containing alcohol dehydrogenase n=1 Tax=Desulfovibrio legallii TaxID=571438 RepID=A0A6H3F866_9BACT|nr:iron-containing alcohol dehydrogenase [Desulfovibrio legallii]RHH26325.1 iron-containing alcohol dehydrogenase [Desulfovibrio sp. AM18-2]TBH81740.1 iron-containing alcohol dehydrogenase [Desulfovibrio legallii]CAI3227009.1 Alcohol dehydrogenase (EC [Desulfovibrio diazotrophicus]